MSSFLDDVKTLGTFAPYEPEEPVQALVYAGQQKQQQFYQGVQRVQGQLDYLAGLPLVKQEHKDYMNQKIGQIQKTVSSSVASDFSDLRLQNQIGGLIKHVGSDPIIENGVQSTLNYQKMLSDINASKNDKDKKGTYSIENEWDVTSKAQQWLNDKDLNSKFDAQYTPYIDVNKKWMDVLKSLKEAGAGDDRIDDIPFVTYQKSDGSIGIDYNKIASVMVERHIKGIPREQLENAITSSLTPDDLNQLAISGRYQFRNATTQDLLNRSNSNYISNISEAQSRLKTLQTEANLSKSDPDKLNQLNDEINSLQSLLGQNGKKGQLEINHDNELSYIQTNPEDAKSEIYKNGTIQEFTNAFSTQHTSLEYKENPFEKVREWNMDYGLNKERVNLERQRVGLEGQRLGMEQANSDRNYDLEMLKYKLELQKLLGTTSGFTTNLGAGTSYISPVEAMKNDIQDKSVQAQSEINDVARRLNTTPQEAEKQILAYEKGEGNEIPVQLREQVDGAIKLRNDVSTMQMALDKTSKQVSDEYYRTHPGTTIESQLQTKAPLNLSINGSTYTFNPKEVFDFITKIRSLTNANASLMNYAKGKLGQIDESQLNSKEKILYGYIKQKGVNIPNLSTKINDPVLNSLFASYAPVVEGQEGVQKEINSQIEQSLLPKIGPWVPQLSNINTPTEASRTNIENIAGSALARLANDNDKNKGLDVSDALKWFNTKDTKDIQYKIYTQGDNTQLWLYKGDKVQKINLNPMEAVQLPNASGILPQNLDIANRLLLGDGNTNPTGYITNSYFKRGDFQKANGLNITGDLQQNSKVAGKFYLTLNLKTHNGWRALQLDNKPMDINNAQLYIQNADNAEILNEFRQAFKNTNSPYLPEIEQMLQKEVTK